MSPAAFPASPDRIERRPAGPVPVGVSMEFRLHDFLQPCRGHGLRDSVRYGGHAEKPGSRAMRFRYFHRFHRRREITAGGHPIPDLIEITLQIGLEVLNRLLIHPRCALVGFHFQPGVPHLLLRYLERLAGRFLLAHAIPPRHLVDQANEPRMSRPLRSAPTASSRNFTATTSRSACAPRDGTLPLALHTLGDLPAARPCRAVSGRAFPRSAREPQIRLTPPPRRAPPGQ